jgi:hypothetical protein
MPPLMLPDTFPPLAAAFAGGVTAPTYQLVGTLVAGWLQCPGRHTVTNVALAAGPGVVGERGWWHSSACQRFVGRARWEPDAVGQVVFTLALRVLPAGWPLVLLVDDSLRRQEGKAIALGSPMDERGPGGELVGLRRQEGKAIALGSMHHDPLRSTRHRPFSRFGHVWVVLAVWLPLPVGVVGGPRGVAVPLVFRRFGGSKRGNRQDAPSRPPSGKR